MGAGASSYDAALPGLRSSLGRTPCYKKPGTPVFAEVPPAALATVLGKGISTLERWDGRSGTPRELLDDLAAHLREYTAPDCAGFRATGSKNGIDYEVHDGLTATSCAGDAYFRLTGTLQLPAKLLLALLMAPEKMGAVDPTVRHLEFFHALPPRNDGAPDGRAFLAYWLAQPPLFVLAPRDGVDLSGWWGDAEAGTYWQGAVTVTKADGADMPSRDGAVRAADMYWGYRLQESAGADGVPQVKATLVCQTALRGNMPVGLKNPAVCGVLADYMRSIEALGAELLKAGRAAEFVEAHEGLSL